jgi:pantoate--beta-alanine ligase
MHTPVTVREMRKVADQLRAGDGPVTLVPTMGALHAGHEALIRAASKMGGAVVVSLFANPLAFGPNEAFASYPRSPEADLEFCRRLGVNAAFSPSQEEMYPKGHSTYVTEEGVSRPLCGQSRTWHFRGVTTIMAKLLNIVRPAVLVLGQRDAQQAAVVRKMAADLNYDVELVIVPTVRDLDGLASGVHGRGFTPSQRQEALTLSRALRRVQEMVEGGVRNADRLIAEATHILSQQRRIRIIYVAMVDSTTMEPVREVVFGRTMLAIAAWVDEVRLTDNVAF